MNKTKIDFIEELLKDKKIRSSTSNKLLALASKEIIKISPENKTVFHTRQHLLKIINDLKHASSVKSGEDWKPKHRPKHVAEFMSLFNKREELKYLTHDFDENGEFEIETFLKITEEIFKQSIIKYAIPTSLYALVQQFCFEKKPSWYFNSIKKTEGWNSEGWINWSKSNKLHPFRNAGYKSVINEFRELTRVDSSTNSRSNLKNIIADQLKIGLGLSYSKFIIEIDNDEIKKADFYTNTERLKRALKKIFELIALNTDKPNINIRYTRDNFSDYFIRQIIITQEESYPSKELELLLKEWIQTEKGDMGEIRNLLYGYCDWSVITKVDGIGYKINILKEQDDNDFIRVNSAVANGFTHILTFYYK